MVWPIIHKTVAFISYFCYNWNAWEISSVRPWFHCQNRESHGETVRLDRYGCTCNKQTSNTTMACTKYGLKSEQARVEHIEAQCACTAAATKSQGAHACYSSDVPFYNSFFTYTLIISWATIRHSFKCILPYNKHLYFLSLFIYLLYNHVH